MISWESQVPRRVLIKNSIKTEHIEAGVALHALNKGWRDDSHPSGLREGCFRTRQGKRAVVPTKAELKMRWYQGAGAKGSGPSVVAPVLRPTARQGLCSQVDRQAPTLPRRLSPVVPVVLALSTAVKAELQTVECFRAPRSMRLTGDLHWHLASLVPFLKGSLSYQLLSPIPPPEGTCSVRESGTFPFPFHSW